MLLHEGVERAFFAMMAKFDVRHVERGCVFLLSNIHDLTNGHKKELSAAVDKLPNEGHATRSTFTRSRVTHFIKTSQRRFKNLFCLGHENCLEAYFLAGNLGAKGLLESGFAVASTSPTT